MEKRILILTISLLLCFGFILPAAASVYDEYGSPNLLVDFADLLTDTEETMLADQLDEISSRHKVNVAVVTVPYAMDKQGDYVSMSTERYANYFFDTYGYGYGDTEDGVLLLINMDERSWYVISVGYGYKAISEAGYDYIDNEIVSYLSDGDYAYAFTRYAEICDELITRAEEGDPYNYEYSYDHDDYYVDHYYEGHNDIYYYETPSGPLSGNWIIISLVVGLIIALIIVGTMVSKMKTVRTQSAANNYIREGSMELIQSRDMFLYRNIHKRRKPQDNARSNHHGGRPSGGSRGGGFSGGGRSGGGGSRGGRGGRF